MISPPLSRRNLLFNALPGTIALLTLACAADKPTEAFAKTVFDEDMTKRTYKVVSFRKTDGKSLDRDGVKRYVMDCEAELEHTRDPVGPRFLQLPDIDPKYRIRIDQAKAGTRVNVKFQIFFEKRESGWVSVNPFS